MKITLVQTIVITNKHKYFACLDELCFKSKNLYNAALYEIRQHYFNEKKYLNYYSVNRTFSETKNVDYIALPYVQMAQQVLIQVDKCFASFFKAIHSPKMVEKKIRIPKYKDKKNGRNIVVYTNQVFKLQDGVIKLKTDRNDNCIYFKTDKTNIQQVRIVPVGNHFNVEIIYKQEFEQKQDNNRYAAIDIGLNNICTLTSNTGQSIIYNGRPLKHINQTYNKRKAVLQSNLQGKKQTSKRIKHLTYKRNNKIKDYLHKLSHNIVEHLKSNQINTLIVGKNKGWKQGICLGKTNNQNFVSIPFNTLIQMLQYKCNIAGIRFVLVKESYTSKCSSFDKEKICKHATYLGTRKNRGIFITSKGIRLNADVNGSLNILRLGCAKLNVTLDVLDLILRPENLRFVLNPVKLRYCG